MTKKERAKKLQEILVELFTPEIGSGQLFVEVQALSAHCILVEILNDKEPGRQVSARIRVHEPNVVRELFEQLTKEN